MKKELKKAQELGLEAPKYNAQFAKEFPHLENDKKEDEYELVEVEEEDLESGTLPKGQYRSEDQISREIGEIGGELQQKKGFLSRIFQKPQKIMMETELSSVRSEKVAQKEKSVVKETAEGTVIMEPRKGEVVKREDQQIKSIFEMPSAIPRKAVLQERHDAWKEKKEIERWNQEHKAESGTDEEAKEQGNAEKKMKKIIPQVFEAEHKKRVRIKPYVDYAHLQNEIKHINKKLEALK